MKEKRKDKLKEKRDIPAAQETENTDQKTNEKGKRAYGKWVRLLLGLLFLFMATWLFHKTLGVRLLFTHVLVGKICRYWLVPAIVGIILLVSGVLSVVRDIKKKDTAQVTEVKKVNLLTVESTENNEKDAEIGKTAEKNEENTQVSETAEKNEEGLLAGEATVTYEEKLATGEEAESNLDSQ